MNIGFIETSEELFNLVKDFYNLTRIKICIYNLDGEEVFYYPEKFSSFCGKYRENKQVNDLCEKCDNLAIEECKKKLKPITYNCHIGLTECIAPIIIDEILYGFVVLGQIKTENTHMEKILLLSDDLIKLFNELPIINEKKMRSSLNILVALTSIEYMKEYIKEIQNSLKTKLINYIDRNLCENLSVDILCETMNVSKRELYSLCSQNYRCTPAELVRERRLYKATVLLTTTKTRINKIAYECGIGDYNYFSKLFRTSYGVSPRVYRKKFTTPTALRENDN